MGPRRRCGRHGPTQTSEPMVRWERLLPATPADTRWRPRPPHPDSRGRTPYPLQTGRTPGRGPRLSQVPGRQTVAFPAAEGRGSGTELRGRLLSPHPQNEFSGGVCARSKFGLNTAGEEFPGVLENWDILGIFGGGYRGEGAAWGTWCRRGAPEVDALTCSCVSWLGR